MEGIRDEFTEALSYAQKKPVREALAVRKREVSQRQSPRKGLALTDGEINLESSNAPEKPIFFSGINLEDCFQISAIRIVGSSEDTY